MATSSHPWCALVLEIGKEERLRCVLCELNIKKCSKTGDVFPASLLKVEEDFQAPLVHDNHRLLGLFCVCAKHHTNHVPAVSVKWSWGLPWGYTSPILTRVFSLRSWLMHLLAMQEHKKQSKSFIWDFTRWWCASSSLRTTAHDHSKDFPLYTLRAFCKP